MHRFALLLAVAAPLAGQFLKPSPNGRYLVREDGTPFLWMGDTAWYAGAKATMEEWTDYLEDRRRKRFSVIQVSAGRTPAGWTGPQPFYPDGKPDGAYWEGIRDKVREANKRGLAVLLVGLGRPTDSADVPRVSAPEYARYIAGLFAGAQVIFSPNFDGPYSPELDTVAMNLFAVDKWHPITQHPNTRQGQNEIYAPKPYLSFHGLQSGHHGGKLEAAYGAAREWPLNLWRLEPVRPVINIEGMYDGRGSDEGPAWRARDVRRIGWISWLSGALGYTYGAGETARKVPGTNGGVWGWNQDAAAFDSWRKAAAWPSSSHMTVMRDFFASIKWWRLEPAHGLIRQEGAPGNEQRAVFAASARRDLGVAYAPAGGAFELDLRPFRGPVRGEWVNPVDGKRVAAGVWAPGTVRLEAPPGGGDWALLVRAGGGGPAARYDGKDER